LDIYTAYAPKDARDDIELDVNRPFDQETATFRNRSMIAIKSKKSDNATCKVIDLPFYDEDKLLPGDLLNLNVK
jgi:hypothetical protein|tara:strand:- start:279 stop:500 length:222 start_codon:yes stop_codon:yes gene_type:complete